MRRPIDSEYIRKKRLSRRPRDNQRKVKRTKMKNDENVVLLAVGMFLSWLGMLATILMLRWG